MRKPIFHNPLVALVVILFVFMSCILVFDACQKPAHEDISIETKTALQDKFFSMPVTTNPVVKAIAKSVLRQDKQRNFLPDLSNKAGYPVWNKALISRPSASDSREQAAHGEVILIPFVKEHEHATNAVLIVNTASNRDTTYKLLYASRYEDFGFDYGLASRAGAKNIFHLFTFFDNEIFGTTKFIVKDRRIITGNPADTTGETAVTLTDGPGTSYENRTVIISFCNTYEFCNTCPKGFRVMSSGCTCGSYTQTFCTTVWIDVDDPGGGGIGGGSGGGGGGGGSGGWENENPCRVGPGGQPCNGGFGNGGWVGVDDEQHFTIESIDISNITDPCLAAVLGEIGNSGHNSMMSKLYEPPYPPNPNPPNNFNNKYQIKYEQNSSLVSSSGLPIAAQTNVTNLGNGVQQLTITLNPSFLHNAAKEFIATVIFHELVHGFLTVTKPLLDATAHHQLILNTYAGSIAMALFDVFPGSFPNALDASSLGLQGIDDVILEPSSSGGYQIIQSQDQLSFEKWGLHLFDARQKALQYLNGTQGHPC